MREAILLISIFSGTVIGSIWIFAFGIHLWPNPTEHWYSIPATMTAIIIYFILCILVKIYFVERR